MAIKIVNYIFLVCVVVLSAQSCYLFNGCGQSDRFDFNVEYSVGEVKDTLHVGDTIKFKHEVPYFLFDENTQQEYDIEEIPYFPYVGFTELKEDNIGDVAKVSYFEVHNKDIGKMEVQIFSEGQIFYNLFMERTDSFFIIESDIVTKHEGEFLMGVGLIDSDYKMIEINDGDDCGNNDNLEFTFNLLGDDNTESRFATDSIWTSESTLRELNLLEQDRMYEFYTFVVVE